MLVLPAVVSEDNCIYVFLTIGGRMPSENCPHAPSAVHSGGLHIKGIFVSGFQTHCGWEGLLPVEYNCATMFCFAHRFCENVTPLFPHPLHYHCGDFSLLNLQ